MVIYYQFQIGLVHPKIVVVVCYLLLGSCRIMKGTVY